MFRLSSWLLNPILSVAIHKRSIAIEIGGHDMPRLQTVGNEQFIGAQLSQRILLQLWQRVKREAELNVKGHGDSLSALLGSTTDPRTSRNGERREVPGRAADRSCRMEKTGSKELKPDLYRPQVGQKHLSRSMALREEQWTRTAYIGKMITAMSDHR
uniref:Secreted protein n=1 Tax=Ascaris lumbricoides TaxID=6252 RepID=A0A0M3IJJ3_ASCLU